MRKTLLFMLSVLICTAALFSCKDGGGGEVNKPTGDNTYSEGTIWAPGTKLGVLVADEDHLDVEKLMYDVIYGCTESNVFYISDPAAEKTGSELVIGNTSREVSVKAYAALERKLESKPDDTGWLVYSYEGSLCLAYEYEETLPFALDYLQNTLLERPTLTLKNGVVNSGTMSLEDLAQDLRAQLRAEGFSELEKLLGAETVKEIKKIYSLVDEKTYSWLVDLYDPIHGGFYYSNSARNNYGYLPDIESTYQALGWFVDSGLFARYGSYSAAVSENLKDQILAFAKNLQSPDNGYFYHPQWGTEISVSRRGRDLNWATSIINAFGDQPLYNTPNGIEGSFGAPGIAPAMLTSSLLASKPHSVSSVIKANDSTLPSYLQSIESFDAYLDSLNIPEKSYSAGNTLSSQASQIKAAGVEYVDYLISYLDRIQNPDNGLWDKEIGYQGVNGLMKISSVYTVLDAVIPNPEAGLRSAVTVALFDDADEFIKNDSGIVQIYNPYVAMNHVLTTVRNSQGKEAAEIMRVEIILPYATELAARTYEKLKLFKCDDNGFSYLVSKSAETSQGVPAAVPNTKEGDVNATTLGTTGVIDNMLRAFGVKSVPLFAPIDGEIVLEKLEALGEIVKDEPRKPQVVTFDDVDLSDVDNLLENGVFLRPADGVENKVSDIDINVNTGNYKWINSTIVQNPDPGSKPGDYVLKTNTFVYEGEEKDKSRVSNSTRFALGIKDMTGNCYIFDADIYFAGMTGNTVIPAQIVFTNNKSAHSFSLNLTKTEVNGKTFLSIGETDGFAGLDGKRDENIVQGIPVGAWFNLRVELYKNIDTEGELSVVAKIYVDGKYKGECDAGFVESGADHFADREITHVSFTYNRWGASEFYLNNIYTEKAAKEFVSEEVPLDGLYDFNKCEEGEMGVKGLNIQQGGLGFMEIVKDSHNSDNMVFRFADTDADKGNYLYLAFSDIPPAVFNAYVFEFDLNFNSYTDGFFQLGARDLSKNQIFSTTMSINNYSDSSYKLTFTSHSNISGMSNKAIGNITVNNTYNRIRLVYFPEAGGFAVYVNTEFIGACGILWDNDSNTRIPAEAKIFSNKSAVLDVYLDNIKAVMETAEAPQIPEEPGDGGGETPVDPSVPNDGIYDFEDSSVGSTVIAGLNPRPAEGDSMSVVDDNGNKVFGFVDANASKGAYLYVSFANTEVDVFNAYSFEFDMKLIDFGGGFLQLGMRDKDGVQIFSTTVDIQNHTESAYKLKFTTHSNIDDNKGQTIGSVDVGSGYVKVRYEYYSETSEIAIYVNSVLVGKTGALFDVNSAGKIPAEFKIFSGASTTLGMYIDNIKALKEICSIPEEPEIPGGGDATDPDHPDGGEETEPDNPEEGEDKPEDTPSSADPNYGKDIDDYDNSAWV